jgi:hypothetical protein
MPVIGRCGLLESIAPPLVGQVGVSLRKLEAQGSMAAVLVCCIGCYYCLFNGSFPSNSLLTTLDSDVQLLAYRGIVSIAVTAKADTKNSIRVTSEHRY